MRERSGYVGNGRVVVGSGYEGGTRVAWLEGITRNDRTMMLHDEYLLERVFWVASPFLTSLCFGVLFKRMGVPTFLQLHIVMPILHMQKTVEMDWKQLCACSRGIRGKQRHKLLTVV
jgi:hypothetical protein